MRAASIRALLGRYELHLSRDRGQHFLLDNAQAARLARLAGVEAGDTIIEIGTGLGALTRALAERAARVVTIEVDAGLVRALRGESLLPGNVELLHADALALDLGDLAAGQPGPVRVVANLPYSAATPLLRRLLDLRGVLRDWSVTLQKEVAERLLASRGQRDYGSFAVLHQLCVEARRLADLPPGAFFPSPRVRSSFLRIVPRADSPLGAEELAATERVARAAFGKRRKTVANSLRAANLAVSSEALEKALAQAGVEPGLRAEEIAPERFLALARALADSSMPGPGGAAAKGS